MCVCVCVLTVRVCGVVVEDAAGGPVEAAHHHKVSLVLWLPAEALLSSRQEAAVLDGRRAELAAQHHGVDQHDGHVAVLQVGHNLLHRHRAVEQAASQ